MTTNEQHTEAPDGDRNLPTLRLPINRSRALTCVATRLLFAAAMVWIGFGAASDDWRLLWHLEKATFFSKAVLVAVAAFAALIALLLAGSWLRLALSRRATGTTITPDSIEQDLGGTRAWRYDWSELRVQLTGDIDPDLIDHLPDETLLPTIPLPADSRVNLIDRILTHSTVDAKELSRLLRPYVRRALQRQTDSGE